MFGVSRQTYYKRIHAEIGRASRTVTVAKMVQQVRLSQPRIGTRKLHYLLRPKFDLAGLKLGRDSLFDLLRRARLLVGTKRCYKKTTHSKHHLHKHPN